MSRGIVVIIPAWNEEQTIGDVVRSCLPHVDAVVVGDNGSDDETGPRARAAGATVVAEPRRGYGSACLAALRWCAEQPNAPRVVVFVDGDGADDPGEIPDLIAPIEVGRADLVIGSRARGARAGRAVAPGAVRQLDRLRLDLGSSPASVSPTSGRSGRSPGLRWNGSR
ncbi:MAG: glycosyltransferase family 2 protein [Candidatus Eisenbacteria bacterium]